MTSKWDKQRKEWDDLLEKAHNVISLGKSVSGSRQADMNLVDLYLRKKNMDVLFWHNFWMVILTSLIVLLTAVNIWLSFYKKP